MMEHSFRRPFLEHLFEALRGGGIRFCVLRNYAALYDDNRSDVDLLVAPADLPRVAQALEAAREAVGAECVREMDFVCRSYIYRRGADLFHIDIEYSKRWRLCPILPVGEILEAATPKDGFFIPSPEHEAIVLWAQAIGAGHLSERYRQRLEALGAFADPARFAALCRRIFGEAGAELPEAPHRGGEARSLIQRLRSVLARRALAQPGAVLRYAGWDARRLLRRLTRPTGLRLEVVSVQGVVDAAALLGSLEVLFPEAKTRVVDGRQRPGLRARLAQWHTLFKGGVVLRQTVVEDDPAATKAATRLRPGGGGSARLAVIGYEAEGSVVADLQSGFCEVCTDPAELPARVSAAFAAAQGSRPARQPGLFCVLLGLDGAGKTAVARALCRREVSGELVERICYLHWIPKPWEPPRLPLPSFGNLPRHAPLPRTAWHAAASSARLVRNLGLAWAAWLLHVRGWRAKGALVLVDRYWFNYWLDAASVRYAGPQWLLAALGPLFPKPDLILGLHAAPEVLHARKQELSLAQMAEQGERLARLLERYHGTLVDASAPLPEVVAEVAAKVEAKLLTLRA